MISIQVRPYHSEIVRNFPGPCPWPHWPDNSKKTLTSMRIYSQLAITTPSPTSINPIRQPVNRQTGNSQSHCEIYKLGIVRFQSFLKAAFSQYSYNDDHYQQREGVSPHCQRSVCKRYDPGTAGISYADRSLR